MQFESLSMMPATHFWSDSEPLCTRCVFVPNSKIQINSLPSLLLCQIVKSERTNGKERPLRFNTMPCEWNKSQSYEEHTHESRSFLVVFVRFCFLWMMMIYTLTHGEGTVQKRGATTTPTPMMMTQQNRWEKLHQLNMSSGDTQHDADTSHFHVAVCSFRDSEPITIIILTTITVTIFHWHDTMHTCTEHKLLVLNAKWTTPTCLPKRLQATCVCI